MWSTTRSSQLTSLTRSASVDYAPQRYDDYGFIAILGLAQRLGVNFLPITWQSALDSQNEDGKKWRGGQAVIHQTTVNVQASLAFKRFHRKKSASSSETADFRDLVNELVILRHEAVRNHPHIVRLEGLCWDIESEKEVSPVLVFEKSELGDLYHFVTHGEGRTLPLREKLDLCVDIGIAIRDMHANNIVHGDIKPQNILVFNHPSGQYTARVADFGFSTYSRGENNLIAMPRSPIWYAPEWHDAYFRPESARKMDIFSYALMCLWMLSASVADPVLPLHPDYQTEEHKVICFDSSRPRQQNLLELWKETTQDHLRTWAKWLVFHKLSDLGEALKSNLCDFFDRALAQRPELRSGDVEYLLKLLAPERCLGAVTIVALETLPLYEEFQLTVSITSFYQMDYRIRPFIASKLVSAASNLSDNVFQRVLPRGIALQLALCYHIGFGVQQNFDEAESIMRQHLIHPSQLKHILSQIQGLQNHTIDYGREGLYGRLQSQGYERFLGSEGVLTPQYYRTRGLLPAFGETVLREMNDLAKVLGEAHALALFLMEIRSELLKDEGHTSEAEKLQLLLKEVRTKVLGADHPETQNISRALAFTYRDQERWADAADLDGELVAQDLRLHGKGHPITNMQMGNLALSLQNKGDYGKAQELYEDVLRVENKTLGPEHPSTLVIKANLACVYAKLENWSEAESLLNAVITAEERILGPEHVDTLLSRGDLANILFDAGRFEEAEKLEAELVEISSRALGEDYPDTLNMMANLARTIQDQGRLEEAADLQLKQLERCRVALGLHHSLTLNSMDNLAINYIEQERWAEAETLLAQSTAARRALQRRDLTTCNVLGHLGRALYEQERWEDAQKARSEELEMSEELLGPEDPDTLNACLALSTAYAFDYADSEDEDANAWKIQKAESLARRVVDSRSEVLGGKHRATVAAMNRLRFIHRLQRRWLDAARVTHQCYQARVEVLGHDDPIVHGLVYELIYFRKMMSVFGPVTEKEIQSSGSNSVEESLLQRLTL